MGSSIDDIAEMESVGLKLPKFKFKISKKEWKKKIQDLWSNYKR
jgi:hypothetical protein